MKAISTRGVLIGAAGAVLGRQLLRRLLLVRLRRDLRALNEGDPGPVLRAYAPDAVLRFNDGPHRWAGEHRGREEIGRFLRDFTSAGLHGELRELWIGGPPWALTVVARFDDEASGPDGETMYRNRVAMVLRTRWGRIVEHDDFYEDTGRILELERALTRIGVPAASAAG
jgi:ketosteroid isomerase-like protein